MGILSTQIWVNLDSNSALCHGEGKWVGKKGRNMVVKQLKAPPRQIEYKRELWLVLEGERNHRIDGLGWHSLLDNNYYNTAQKGVNINFCTPFLSSNRFGVMVRGQLLTCQVPNGGMVLNPMSYTSIYNCVQQ